MLQIRVLIGLVIDFLYANREMRRESLRSQYLTYLKN